MANLKINISDESGTVDQAGSPLEVKRNRYRVVSEVGVFKRGKLYGKNEFVELDEVTAKAAIESGDVEEVKEKKNAS